MATQGTADLNFGASPGADVATVAVTGQAAIVAGSLVEAWVRPVATADHSADEHMVEDLWVVARDIVAGTGFTIYGMPITAPGGKVAKLRGVYTCAWVWN